MPANHHLAVCWLCVCACLLTTAIVSGFDHNIQAPVIGQVYFSSVLIAENSEYEVRQSIRMIGGRGTEEGWCLHLYSIGWN